MTVHCWLPGIATVGIGAVSPKPMGKGHSGSAIASSVVPSAGKVRLRKRPRPQISGYVARNIMRDLESGQAATGWRSGTLRELPPARGSEAGASQSTDCCACGTALRCTQACLPSSGLGHSFSDNSGYSTSMHSGQMPWVNSASEWSRT